MFPEDTKIILTTVPTGLGHIRVTNALREGLPKETHAEIIGVEDPAVETLYHLISTNYFLRKMFEFTQNNKTAERLITNLLRFHQNKSIDAVLHEITQIIQKNPAIKKLVIVSTHAFIGDKIQKLINRNRFPVEVFHALIVTDDSPQRFWMVSANITFVPSYKTKKAMENLYTGDNLKIPRIEVAPYPINPHFTEKLPPHILFNKIEQLDPINPQRARICIPVSGAAVQLEYYQKIIEELTGEETTNNFREFAFSIVTRVGNYTKPFIEQFKNNPQVIFHIGASDLHTVDLYDELYEQLSPPSLEITKPSEQAFKVLTTPDTKGGPILLLTDPVGKQEYDNLDYLERFGFLPSQKIHEEIYERLITSRVVLTEPPFTNANTWRTLRLPQDPYKATRVIINGLKSGLFKQMQNYKKYEPTQELSPHGVKIIWETIHQTTNFPSS
jgi:hypothetical protein